jgi:hypothetical protein
MLYHADFHIEYPASLGGGRIETCMTDHFADLSDACKEVISQAGGGKS